MNRGGFDRKLGVATLFSVIDSTSTSVQALGAAAGAWLDLAIRFWLAKAFLTQPLVSMAMHAPMTMSITSAAPTINGLVASPLGAVVAALVLQDAELACFFSRVSVVAAIVVQGGATDCAEKLVQALFVAVETRVYRRVAPLDVDGRRCDLLDKLGKSWIVSHDSLLNIGRKP
jgi:hypothetical protein